MSSQKEIELILARQLASYLAMPIFIVDPLGNLIYYNEPAEMILGRRFEETGEMPVEEWSTLFQPTDESGKPLAPKSLPLMVALTQHSSGSSRDVDRGVGWGSSLYRGHGLSTGWAG